MPKNMVGQAWRIIIPASYQKADCVVCMLIQDKHPGCAFLCLPRDWIQPKHNNRPLWLNSCNYLTGKLVFRRSKEDMITNFQVLILLKDTVGAMNITSNQVFKPIITI